MDYDFHSIENYGKHNYFWDAVKLNFCLQGGYLNCPSCTLGSLFGGSKSLSVGARSLSTELGALADAQTLLELMYVTTAWKYESSRFSYGFPLYHVCKEFRGNFATLDFLRLV